MGKHNPNGNLGVRQRGFACLDNILTAREDSGAIFHAFPSFQRPVCGDSRAEARWVLSLALCSANDIFCV